MSENKVKTKNRICICIPNYNRSKTIVECVASVVNQRETSFDIIIQDDCSSDDSVDKIRAKFGDRVFIRINKENLGFGGNLSRCLSYASDYEWVGILHSDDRHEPGSLKVFKSYLETNLEAGIIFSQTNDIGEAGNYLTNRTANENLLQCGDTAILKTFGVLPYSTIFYRSLAILRLGLYDPRFRHSGDEEYNARILKSFAAVQVNGVWGCYRRHSGQTMIRSWAQDDFIPSYELMKLTINSYLTERNRLSDSDVRRLVAETLFDHCSSLVANDRNEVARKFYRYLYSVSPLSLLRPKRILRVVIQQTPWFGQKICSALSKNAGQV